MKAQKTKFKMAQSFCDKMLHDPEIRMHYKQEKAKTHVAYAVKAARTRAGLTQAELAEKIGTPQSVIARLESVNDTRTPSLDLLASVTAACDAELELGFRFAS
jgi:ribosome-binding protein aMBF1 (putative translation factor)